MSPPPPSPLSSIWNRRGPRRWGQAQGWFYFVSGLWPVLHLPSFIYVTGPKVDLWLVQTVGALLAVTGLSLALASHRDRLSSEWALLAGGQALALALVDIIFVSRDRIAPIYLADAAVQLGLVAGWLVFAFSARSAARHDAPAQS